MDSYREIETLIYCYAERVDAGDFKAVAEMFAHGRILGKEDKASGYGEILSLYERSARIYEHTGTPCTRHVTTKVIIELDEENNSAEARSYFTVFQALEDFPLQPVMAGRYHDRFERIDGKWRFSSRQIVPELYGDLSRHLLFDVKELQKR